jgi:hypothetical protein
LLRPAADAEEWPAGWKWALAAILAAGAIVFVAGVTSRIVLAARGLAGWWEKRWVLAPVGLAAFAHLGVTAWFVSRSRQLTPGQEAVFAYLRTHTPEGTRVMYPGEVIMAEARRPVVWSHLTDPETGKTCLPEFWLQTDPQRIETLLRANRVDYICAEESRILSGPLAKAERGGYPSAFVDLLPHLPFLEKVAGDWPGTISLWKVKGDFRWPARDAPETDSPPPLERSP